MIEKALYLALYFCRYCTKCNFYRSWYSDRDISANGLGLISRSVESDLAWPTTDTMFLFEFKPGLALCQVANGSYHSLRASMQYCEYNKDLILDLQ